MGNYCYIGTFGSEEHGIIIIYAGRHVLTEHPYLLSRVSLNPSR